MKRMLVVVLAVVLLSGCSSYSVAKYGIAPDNAVALKALNGNRVTVGPFRAAEPGRKEIGCRAVGPIKTPDGLAFEEYVRRALIDELRLADVYTESAPVSLDGHLTRMDFSSTSGKWFMDLTLASSNGRSVQVSEAYDYETSFIGEKGCALTAQAFAPAVQSLIGKLVRSPEFAGLLK
jgi:hypothetical protein